jgi:hypothetical protein
LRLPIHPMREKNFSTGLRGVLFEARHFERMGSAIWLYGWLVLRQTHQTGTFGWVLGGAPVNYREIEEETGFNRRTLERWMQTLRRGGYIETEAVPAGITIRITKAKKFAQAPRQSAEGVRRTAEGATRNSGSNSRQNLPNHIVADRIGSSSVVRLKERQQKGDFHRDFHKNFHRTPQNQAHSSGKGQTGYQPSNPSCLSENQNQEPRSRPISQSDFQTYSFQEMRMCLQLLRAKREEAVRRELRVGTGPNVRDE